MSIKQRFAVAALTIGIGLIGGGAGVVGLKDMEGRENHAYVDRLVARPVVTICYGHTATAKMGQYKTDAECNKLLLDDLNRIYAPEVRKLVTVPLTQGEFNALVDFAYNLGSPALAKSTLLKLVNQRRYAEAALEFRKWKFVDGKDCYVPSNKCGGIPKRREWQRQMFVS